MWHELDRDQYVITHAMNTPGGAIIRVSHTYEPSKFQLQYVPGTRVVKNTSNDSSNFVLVHG